MNKKLELKNEVIVDSFKEEEEATVITSNRIVCWANITVITLEEIITLTPYSVFGLCKLYEYFQRN